MSVSALGARAPAAASATTPGGSPTAAAQGSGDNAFAALLAGLGVALPDDGGAQLAGTASDGAPAAGTPQDGTAPGEALADAALPGAVPDPMAGMALLMAQFPQALAPVAAPGTAQAAAPLGAAGAPSSTALAGVAQPDQAAGQATDPGWASAALPAADPGAPPAVALQAAAPSDAGPAGQVAQPLDSLQALPGTASLAAGWAAAPVPAAAQGGAAAPPVYQAALASRPGDAAFTGDLAAQVTVLVEGGFQQAELRLNPPELGPIQIQLSVSPQTQTADISFSAVHGMTRESIEQSLPALREMLQAQGLTLGETGVSGGQPHPGGERESAAQQARQARPGAATAGGGGALDDALPAPGARARATRGMLDVYA